jgi:hypothetical protein
MPEPPRNSDPQEPAGASVLLVISSNARDRRLAPVALCAQL